MYLSRREIFLYCLLAVFTAVWAGAFSLLGIDFHHDGIMFKAALDVAAGKWVFRETFCQYGLLSPLMQGALLKLAGGELVVLKLATALFYAGIAVMNDLVWRRFLSLPFRLLNILMFFILAPYLIVPFHIWSSVYALFFMLAATESALLFLEKRHRGFLFFSGACAMLASGFRWPCGAVTLAAGIAVLLLDRKSAVPQQETENIPAEKPHTVQDLSALFSGSGCILLLYALYLTLGKAWSSFLQQTFAYTGRFAWQRGGSGALHQILGTFFPHSEMINYIFLFIPVAVLILAVFLLRELLCEPQKRRQDLTLAACLVFALASYHQYYPVPCLRHLYWGALPMFGAYCLCMQKILASGNQKFLKILLISFMSLPLLGCGGLRLYGGIARLDGFFKRKTIETAGVRHIRLNQQEYFLCGFAGYLQKTLPPELKQRGIFNNTPDGLWPALLPEVRDFASPVFVNWEDRVYPDYPRQAMEYIDRKRPLVISYTDFYHPEYVKAAEVPFADITCKLYISKPAGNN